MITTKPTSLRSFTALLEAVLLLFFVCPANATVFFDDDVESPANLSGWPYINASSAEIVVTTAQKFTGTQSIQLTYPPSAADVDYGAPLGRSYPNTTHIFLRFAYKTSVPFYTGLSTGLSKMMWIYGDTYQLAWLELQGNPSVGSSHQLLMMTYAYDQPDVQRLNTGKVIDDGQWHQIEIEGLLNTPGVSDGLIRIWVDNVLRLESLNRQFLGPTPSSVAPWGGATPSNATLRYLQIYRQAGQGMMYYDRVALGDTRIGVIVIGQAPPPNTPSGLTLSQIFTDWFSRVWAWLAPGRMTA